MNRIRLITIALCLWRIKIEIMHPEVNVTITSPTFNAHFCSGTNEEKMSGRGCLNKCVVLINSKSNSPRYKIVDIC